MDGKERDGLDAVRDQHASRTYDAYKAAFQGFKTSLGLVVAFGAVFFFLVLVPYFVTDRAQKQVQSQLVQAEARQGPLQARILEYSQPLNAIADLQSQMAGTAADLHAWLATTFSQDRMFVEQELFATQVAQDDVPLSLTSQVAEGCRAAGRLSEWRNCMVHGWLTVRIDQYQKDLNEKVLQPLQAISGVTTLVNVAAMRESFKALAPAMTATLNRVPPDFWRNYDAKEGLTRDLWADVESAWSPFRDTFEAQRNELDASLKELQTSSEDLRTKLVDLRARENALGEKISNIQSPLGKLPVGLVEAVMLFPFLLAAGFIDVDLRLLRAYRLRESFQRVYQRKDPRKRVLSDGEVALIAPLWLDPLEPGMSRFQEAVAMSSVPIMFVASVVLIVVGRVWVVPNTDAAPWLAEPRVYFGLYAVALVALLVFFSRVVRGVQRYGTSSEDRAAS